MSNFLRLHREKYCTPCKTALFNVSAREKETEIYKTRCLAFLAKIGELLISTRGPPSINMMIYNQERHALSPLGLYKSVHIST